MSIMELFKFVTDVTFSNEEAVVDARLEQIQEEMNANPNLEVNTAEDEIFMKSYIPTTLEEVIDIDRDTLIVEEGGGKNLVYADLLGTGVTASVQQMSISDSEDDGDNNKDEKTSDSEGDSEDDSDEDSEDEEEDGKRKPRPPKGKKNEDKDDKKDRKKKAKEEAREKRKHKLPKAEKKRKIKTSSKKKK